MIEVFYYSIQGKKTNQIIDDLIQSFLDSEYVPKTDKKILNHIQEVAVNGNYPTAEYFSIFYPKAELTYRSLAEIKTYCKKTLDFYHKQAIEKKLIEAINDSQDVASLLTKVQEVGSQVNVVDEDEIGSLQPKTYGALKSSELVKGINIGVKEIDEVTNGAQPGTVMSICAFTGHGKSTLVESVLFKNALEGNKCCLVSLELAPEIIWCQLEARYMNQVKGIQVTAQDLQFRKMPSDIEERVIAAEEDFKEELASNIVIIDEGFISKQIMLDYKSLSALMRQISAKLGGLNIIAFDHVGQLELMFPDCGNKMIKTIQSFTKTFKDSDGNRPISIMAVQANREGEKRARKRNGVYDLQAISELNEVERTSTYIVFMYTSDDMKIMQETKITMPKHRLGAVVTEPVVTTFNPAIITVGAAIDNVIMSDDDFNGMDLDLGGDFEDFV